MRKHAIIFSVLILAVLVISPMLASVKASANPSLDYWTGQGALAQWTVQGADRNGNPVTITMNATVGQQTTSTPSLANMIYIGVSHGSSSTSSDNLNYTTTATWDYEHGNIQLSIAGDQLYFNGRAGLHNISVQWTLAENTVQTQNQFIDINGQTVAAVGIWNTAKATMIIDGETGPHPTIYTSDWAVMGLHQPIPTQAVPEVPLGTIAASAVMIVALGAFIKTKKPKIA
jgi:hypothetical protein